MRTSVYRTALTAMLSSAIALIASAAIAQISTSTTTTTQTVQTAPDWVGNLLFGTADLTAMNDPVATQEELPGLGHKFFLLFAMHDDQDPQNPTNDVISMVGSTDFPAGTGVALRQLPPGIKITALDHQINLKYFFPLRTCANGGPRIELAVDADGNGSADFNAFGYVGHAPFGAGCITGDWDIVDMTDNIARWDLSQFIIPGTNPPVHGGMAMTWDQVMTFITTVFPNHKVLSGSLVDDGCAGGGVTACGQAYYDLVTIENRTLENRQDTVRNNK